jgi:hypothetical protein
MGMASDGRSFARSINEYRWARGSSDRPDKTNGADHACDALRYWAINAKWPGDRAIPEASSAFRSIHPIRNHKKKSLGVDR